MDYLRQLGADVEVVRNDEITIDQIRKGKYSGLVLSPGPGTPVNSGVCMEVLEAELGVPILGVCLGMQAIAVHYGGNLQKADYPMHGKVSELKHTGHPMFEGVDATFDVCRYHSLVVDSLDRSPLEVTAFTSLGEVMAVAHRDKFIWGVQFHPEAILTLCGKQILANWIKAIKLQ